MIEALVHSAVRRLPQREYRQIENDCQYRIEGVGSPAVREGNVAFQILRVEEGDRRRPSYGRASDTIRWVDRKFR